jgi:UDP-N-acetylglucosamine--N-acetylmuramyl-(pentapeptide) pyrophosphoryl-undecaprenol N-acetylglucosamine transferase
MTKTRKILITGAHITPALELIRQLKNDQDTNWEIYYIGRLFNSSVDSDVSIESKVIPQNGVKFYGIPCGKLDRRWLPNTLSGLPQIFSGFKEAQKIINRIKPHLVVSFGGYVSVPVIIAASINQIPSITHEQTQTLSLSTKINALFCKYIATSFPTNKYPDKQYLTGNLLRREIFSHHSVFFEKQKIDLKKYPLIYLTAGNQGSHHLNLVLKELLPSLTKNFTIIHQTGLKDFTSFTKLSKKYSNYYVKNYIGSKDIGWIFHNSKLIISRAGANTTQEIAALNLNSIIIPLPVSQQNEQIKNAIWLQKKLPKNTIIINDTELSNKLLENSIKKLLSKRVKKSLVTPSPNLKLLKLIKKL